MLDFFGPWFARGQPLIVLFSASIGFVALMVRDYRQQHDGSITRDTRRV